MSERQVIGPFEHSQAPGLDIPRNPRAAPPCPQTPIAGADRRAGAGAIASPRLASLRRKQDDSCTGIKPQNVGEDSTRGQRRPAPWGAGDLRQLRKGVAQRGGCFVLPDAVGWSVSGCIVAA